MENITDPKITSWETIIPSLKAGKHKKILEKAYGGPDVVYPPKKEVFNALTLCQFENIKVVLLGQDPYHGEDQAMGLSFSVRKGIRCPPSLRNIFKEITADIYKGNPPEMPTDLTHWAQQGVLLLNTVLTVKADQANSHAKIMGWEEITDDIIRTISDKRQNVVFMLLGRFAQKKEILIDSHKHYICKAGHPSPLSARYFLGQKVFSKTNYYLTSKNIKPIIW